MEDNKKIEILKKLLGINDIEARILIELLNKNGMSVMELSMRLNIDRSYVQKSIRNLLRRRIIDRYQKNLIRGRCYIYFISKRKLKQRLKRELRGFLKEVECFINEL